MGDLHEIELELLLSLADFAEEHGLSMSSDQLLVASGLEHAQFVRRVRYLMELGLVRVERARPLAEHDQRVVLTGKGTLRVVAERAAARALPAPGVRSRLSPLADCAEGPDEADPLNGGALSSRQIRKSFTHQRFDGRLIWLLEQQPVGD